MKFFFGIIVLGLLLSGCILPSKSNDLVGKKILCGEWSRNNEVLITKLPISGYNFFNKDYVKYYKISETHIISDGVISDVLKYKIKYDEILIIHEGLEHILNRNTGIRRTNYSNATDVICKPLSDDKNIRKMLKKIYKLRLENLKF